MLLAWLAVLAMVIVPTVSRATTPLDLAQYRSDLCRSGDVAMPHDTLSACGLCVVAAAPLLPAAATVWRPPAAGAEPPAATGVPAQAVIRHHPAQARGPPALA